MTVTKSHNPVQSCPEYWCVSAPAVNVTSPHAGQKSRIEFSLCPKDKLWFKLE